MDITPTPTLLNTFRVALGLKLMALFFALALGYVVLGNWLLRRWGLALVDVALLALLLAPSEQWLAKQPSAAGRLLHRWRLPLALALALLFPHLELVYVSLLQPGADMLLALQETNWTVERATFLQAEAVMFIVVPVVLASWQYGRPGLILSLLWATALHLATGPFLVQTGSDWPIHLLRGFVQIGLLFVVGFIVQTLVTVQRREHAALEAANRKLAEQAAAMEQLATSRERNRLARELHDTLAHSLSGTAVQLQALGTLLRANPEAAAQQLKAAQKEVRHGLEEARRAIAALRASPLEELGLIEALRQRATNLGERAGMAVQCNLAGPANLPPLTEQTIYRIADEAMVNAEKYAQASQLYLQLSGDEAQWTLIVQDNGVGFDPYTTHPSNGRYGLIGMRERAALIGATVTIESKTGEGTSVILQAAQAK